MDYETKKVSKCCRELADQDEHKIWYCTACGKDCQYEIICAECEGTGFVDDPVYDGDSHRYHPTGKKKCLCQLKPEEDAT